MTGMDCLKTAVSWNKRLYGRRRNATMRSLCREEKKELKVLASDFELLHREDVQEIIETCRSYEEGRRKILQVYTAVYM